MKTSAAMSAIPCGIPELDDDLAMTLGNVQGLLKGAEMSMPRSTDQEFFPITGTERPRQIL
jgi:hypothetical protein